jgi:hypothetical protein
MEPIERTDLTPTATESVDTAATEEAEDEPKRGKVIETFLVRVTLRANEDGTEGRVPTNDQMAAAIEEGLYIALTDFERVAINATAEKV